MTHFDPVATWAASNPSGLAVVDLASGRRWSYRDLHLTVDRLAAWLVQQFGPNSAERVATLSRNCAEVLILQLASVRAGTLFAPFNPRLATAEVETLAADAEPAILFHESGLSAPTRVARSLPIGGLLELGAAGQHPPPEARREFEDVATLLYTSGTSGRPKGVMLSERNVFFGCTNFIYGNDVTRRSVFLCDMPLFHTAGLHAATRVPLHAGGTVLISAGFDAPQTLQRLMDPDLGITHYFSVPQMASRLWNEPAFDARRLRKLVCWMMGGAPIPKALTQRFLMEEVRITESFGMSETGSNFGMPNHDMQMLRTKAGSCGLPYATIEARLVGDDEKDVETGKVGELWLRGPSITSGYWRQPEATAAAFRNGWFRTGDAAMRDEDGFYHVVDRRKDMYISGGENVYPAEVEAAIAELESVAECAVVGVPDEQWGEVGRAYVITAPGRTVTEEQILAHCRTRLARFKAPKSVMITTAVPRTASGKVQKNLLRRRALEELGSG